MWVSPIYLYMIFKSCRSPWQGAEHSGKPDKSREQVQGAIKEKIFMNLKKILSKDIFYLILMAKAGRPKKKITSFLDFLFIGLTSSVVLFVVCPSPYTLLAVGTIWLLGEVINAFR